MWEQIRSYKQQQGAAALKNFKLNILGQIMDNFTVPGVRYDGVLACAATIQHCCSSAATLGNDKQFQRELGASYNSYASEQGRGLA
jgi:hypothetical protein